MHELMTRFEYQQGLTAILEGYAQDMDVGLVSVLSAIGKASGTIGQHLK